MALLAIDYKASHLRVLNQLMLPQASVYDEVNTVEDAWTCIRAMKVFSSDFGTLYLTYTTDF